MDLTIQSRESQVKAVKVRNYQDEIKVRTSTGSQAENGGVTSRRMLRTLRG